jgi:7-cyano-7-deazaguanine synthase
MDRDRPVLWLGAIRLPGDQHHRYFHYRFAHSLVCLAKNFQSENFKMKKTVIILSGGMDSTTLAYDLHNKDYELHALSFDYGQKHRRELLKAGITCRKLSIPHKVVALQTSMRDLVSNSSLIDPKIKVPFGHYAAENMKSTVVPNRNMIMLSMAVGWAINIGAEAVAYGAHAGDHTIYPDCRPEFAEILRQAFALCHFEPIHLITPYMHLNKNDICVIGRNLNVPYEDTWTCYVGDRVPCGKCGACQERAEAFAFAGIIDPLTGG